MSNVVEKGKGPARAHLSPMEVHDGWIENLKSERRTAIQ
jgi:hypothetical protein